MIGEVGRGTYVRSDLGTSRAVPPEPPPSAVDLQRTMTYLPEQEAVLAETLAKLGRSGAIEAALQQHGPTGTPHAQAVAALFLAAEGYAPAPADIRFAGNGRQGIAAALAALASPGERIGCEPLTYPVVKGIASRLGIALIPLAMDDEGLCPDAVLQTHRVTPLSGLYLQPSLQNPSARRWARSAGRISLPSCGEPASSPSRTPSMASLRIRSRWRLWRRRT